MLAAAAAATAAASSRVGAGGGVGAGMGARGSNSSSVHTSHHLANQVNHRSTTGEAGQPPASPIIGIQTHGKPRFPIYDRHEDNL